MGRKYSKHSFQRESAVVVYNLPNGVSELLSVTLGHPAAVEFDFLKVWEFTKGIKDFDPENLHFLHVHPPGFTTASALDVECARGFTTAFGYPVKFSVVAFESEDLFDLGCQINTYQYLDKLTLVETEGTWDDELFLLKGLSYADSLMGLGARWS